MKVFYVEGYFELPEDFEGDVSDAFNELLKYRVKETTKKSRRIGDIDDKPKSAWDNFVVSVAESKKFGGNVGLFKYDLEKGTAETVIDFINKKED